MGSKKQTVIEILQRQLNVVFQLQKQSQQNFTHFSDRQMDQAYQDSGFTPNMLLASYNTKIQDLRACKQWVESIIE